jgi:uncharacterized membrane-anchored protein YitT (DUF2179 family)
MYRTSTPVTPIPTFLPRKATGIVSAQDAPIVAAMGVGLFIGVGLLALTIYGGSRLIDYLTE